MKANFRTSRHAIGNARQLGGMMFKQQESTVGVINFGWAVGFGVLTIGLLIWLGLTAPPTGCGSGTLAPVMALQAAASSADLVKIFGSDASACLAVVHGLAVGSQADLFLFIPVYAVFLIFFVFALKERTAMTTFALLTALALTVAGDIAETRAQLQILEDVNAGSQYLGNLMAGNGFKIFGLSLFLAGASAILWRQPTRTARITATLLAALAAARIAGYLVEDIQPLAPLSALGAFIILWAYAGKQFINSRRSMNV